MVHFLIFLTVLIYNISTVNQLLYIQLHNNNHQALHWELNAYNCVVNLIKS